MKKKYLSAPTLRSLLLTLAIALTCMAALSGKNGHGRNKTDINTVSRHLKARALTDLSAITANNDPLLAYTVASRAANLAPNDTTVLLELNNRILLSQHYDSATFANQYALLAATPAASESYYVPVMVMARLFGGNDSLFSYKVARLAADRKPDNIVLTRYAIREAVQYLAPHRFKAGFKYNSDTLALSERDKAFAHELIDLADASAARNGYDPDLDMTKGQLLYILNDTTALRNLAEQMMQRDPDSPETLNNLTNIYISLGDTAYVTELGLRSFEIMPDPDVIYSLYISIDQPDQRQRLTDASFKAASNPDLEPELRVGLLNSLMKAYYERTPGDSLDTKTEIPRHVDTIATEVITEDPADFKAVLSLALIARATHWVENYGYKYLLDYAVAYPDSIDNVAICKDILTAHSPYDQRIVTLLSSVAPSDTTSLQVDRDMALANYLINNGHDDEALELLEPITMSQLRQKAEQEISYMKADTDSDADNPAFDDEEMDVDKRTKDSWVLVKTIISETQQRLDRIDDAMASMRDIISVDPENAMALNNIAYISAENGGDLQEALVLINRSLDLSPENANALDSRAWIYYLLGNYDDALADMKKFFETIRIPYQMVEDASDNAPDLIGMLAERRINIEAITPILGHLLALYDKLGDDYSASAVRVANVLAQLDSDNDQYQAYIKDHPEFTPDTDK